MKTAAEHLAHHRSMIGRTGVYGRSDSAQSSLGTGQPTDGPSESEMMEAPSGGGIETGEPSGTTATSADRSDIAVGYDDAAIVRTDPPVSEAQRKAMWAAKSGNSTLGIPKSAGVEFAEADPGGKLPDKSRAVPRPQHTAASRGSPATWYNK